MIRNSIIEYIVGGCYQLKSLLMDDSTFLRSLILQVDGEDVVQCTLVASVLIDECAVLTT